MDIVYFLRAIPPPPSEFGRIAAEEIRYSLRSMCTNFADLGEVHVFGGRPPWLSGLAHHYPVKQGRSKHENTWAIWRQIASAARNGYLPDEFLIMNDDHFLMEPVTSVPPYVTGPAEEWAQDRHKGTVASAVANGMRRTMRAVAAHPRGPALADQLSYELHVPLPVHGPTLAEIWPYLDEAARSGRVTHRILKRSAYGNLAGLNATAVRLPADVKVKKPGEPLPSLAWWSTADDTFRFRSRHDIGVRIRAAFPRACRFEALPPVTVARSTRRTVPGDTPRRRAAPR